MKRDHWITLGIVALVALVLFTTYDYRRDCRAKGGTPITGDGGWACLAPGVAIP